MLCPPAKPTSSLVLSVLAMRDDLREDAVDGVGVDEGDLQTEEAGARMVVDQLDAVGLELAERHLEIGDLVRDVVHPGASLGEEPAHRRLLAECGDELDAAVADTQRRRLDALV